MTDLNEAPIPYAKHLAALIYAIERAGAEYKSYCETWDTIDRKAQTTTTIAGAFLAAIFAFIPHFDVHAEPLLVVAILSVMLVLLFTILAALFAMRARESTLPPSVMS